MASKKQPQASAHVAVYYANKAEIMGRGVVYNLVKEIRQRGDYILGGSQDTIHDAELHLTFVKKAAHEWVMSGGV